MSIIKIAQLIYSRKIENLFKSMLIYRTHCTYWWVIKLHPNSIITLVRTHITYMNIEIQKEIKAAKCYIETCMQNLIGFTSSPSPDPPPPNYMPGSGEGGGDISYMSRIK